VHRLTWFSDRRKILGGSRVCSASKVLCLLSRGQYKVDPIDKMFGVVQGLLYELNCVRRKYDGVKCRYVEGIPVT